MTNKKLAFGLMRLPLTNKEDQSSVDQEELNKMVKTAMDNGFNHFDTAYPYHEGKSETALKKALVDKYPREDYKISNKLPSWDLTSPEDSQKIFDEQLQRCGVEYFDYYLLHNIGETFYNIALENKAFEFLQKIKKEGKAKHIGFSIHDDAEFLDKVLTKHPEMEFVLLQINYLDWEDKSIESKNCYDIAKKHGVKIFVMEAVKGGFLANIPETIAKKYKEYNPEASISSWAVRFVASLDVEKIFVGMSNYEQMLDNISYMKDFKPLNTEEQKIIQESVEIIRNDIAVPCNECNYCIEECPNQIPIPKYLALYNDKKRNPDELNPEYLYMNLSKKGGKASDCNACAECEEHCPQHIDIIEKLEEIAELFEIELP